MNRPTAARYVLRALCPAALLAVLVAIWALTVQTPAQTMSLSGPWTAAIARLFGMPLDTASWIARKAVHTVEFFPVGFLLALTIVAWDRRDAAGSSRRRAALVVGAVAICFACSLGDQVHKAFVPGREFDALDMCFDAAGYLLGVWIVCAVERKGRRKGTGRC